MDILGNVFVKEVSSVFFIWIFLVNSKKNLCVYKTEQIKVRFNHPFLSNYFLGFYCLSYLPIGIPDIRIGFSGNDSSRELPCLRQRGKISRTGKN